MRDFLWEGIEKNSSTHLVSWDIISKPKEDGGLGIGNLTIRNKALLGKWWWRFPKEKELLWGRVIAIKYGMQENGWDPGLALRTTLF